MRTRVWIRWLVPDLAMALSLVTLLVCLFLFDGTRTLFRDSDTGWHIRTGEMILSRVALPSSDPYSFTRGGSPWVAWEWGADVIMGAAHQLGGLAAVAALYGFVIAACTWMWVRLHWVAGGNFLLACAMSTLLLSTGNIHWLARPHVFGWLLLIGFVLHLEKNSPELWVVALLSAIWANIHASFFLAPLTLLIYAASFMLRPLIWTLHKADEWKKARWYAIAAVVAGVATLANPYGARVHLHIFRYLSDRELISRIGEFQSFNFHAEGGGYILLTVAVAGLGGVLALSQRRLAHFFLAAMWIAIALRSARVLPIVGLLLLPLANSAISQALAEAHGLQPRLRNWLDGFREYSANLRRIDMSMRGWAFPPVIAFLIAAVLPTARAGFPPEFPAAAANAIDKLPQDIRLLAPDLYGGYLIYRFNGGRKVFFDGRSDFYGSDYMKNYLRLIELRPGWQQQLAELGFTHALLPNRYSLVPALEQLGWKRIYSDDVATLLERH